MADANGTPTSLGIPTYNTASDPPSGKGFNEAMAALNTIIGGYILKTLTTTTGDIIYASGANTPARLGIGSAGDILTVAGGIPTWAASTNVPKRARTKRTATQSINNSTLTVVTFDAEDFDNDTIHDNATNPGRLTATTAGIYLVEATLVYAATAGGSIRSATIRKNAGTAYAGNQAPGSSGTVRTDVSVSALVDMSATDYVECLAFHDQGGALNIEVSNGTTGATTHFSMTRLGALT